MYSNCAPEFQQLDMKGIAHEKYAATMLESQRHSVNFSAWLSGAGFYVARCSKFAAFWSLVAEPKDSVVIRMNR